MHILCTICSDLVNQAENLYVTKCGHIFHHKCLAQWLERGTKSCPQCRNKVTDKCMFRMYPTVSNESSGEDAATLQSRLDDAMLELRTQQTKQRDLQDKLSATTLDLNKKEESLKAAEKRLVSRESAVTALREQLQCVRIQNQDMARLREENEQLKKNMQTLNGLQKVLNATAGEVEETLRGYSDLRTLATFAAALKRALCDSEEKKRAARAQLHAARQRLLHLQDQLGQAQEQLASAEALRRKREAGPAHAPRAHKLPRAADTAPEDRDLSLSFGSAVTRIVQADSPYLQLKQSGLALCALQQHAQRPQTSQPTNLKPSEFALGSSATSIFRAARPAPAEPRAAAEPYDGLGGHSRADTFPAPLPAPRPRPAPRVSRRHRLRRPAQAQDIALLLAAPPPRRPPASVEAGDRELC